MTNHITLACFTLPFALLLQQDSCSSKPTVQSEGQKITEAYAKKLSKARPYPLDDMNDSAERANLTERLLRMNKSNKIGYLYLFFPNGQLLNMYTIKGKVSSTASQLTNTQSIEEGCTNRSGYCSGVVETMGDDGSYGPEEGGTNGIFAFTTSGVLVEWNGLWHYSDAPLELTSKPLLIMSVDAKPTSTAGQLGTPPKNQPQQ